MASRRPAPIAVRTCPARLVVLGTRPSPLNARGIVARGFRNRGGSLSRRSRPDSAFEGESEAKREGQRGAIARFYRAIRARGIRNWHSLPKHVVLGTFGDVVSGTRPAWFWEPGPVVTGTLTENFMSENKEVLSF
jgi:hypothetical protein